MTCLDELTGKKKKKTLLSHNAGQLEHIEYMTGNIYKRLWSSLDGW